MSIVGGGAFCPVETWFPEPSRVGRVAMLRGVFVDFRLVYRKPSNHQKLADSEPFYCESFWGTAHEKHAAVGETCEDFWGTALLQDDCMPLATSSGAVPPPLAGTISTKACDKTATSLVRKSPEPQIHSPSTPMGLHLDANNPTSTHQDPQKVSARFPSPQTETHISHCPCTYFRNANSSMTSSVKYPNSSTRPACFL